MIVLRMIDNDPKSAAVFRACTVCNVPPSLLLRWSQGRLRVYETALMGTRIITKSRGASFWISAGLPPGPSQIQRSSCSKLHQGLQPQLRVWDGAHKSPWLSSVCVCGRIPYCSKSVLVSPVHPQVWTCNVSELGYFCGSHVSHIC